MGRLNLLEILLSMQVEKDISGLLPHQITTIALVVNELATNAIKHAFEEGKAGHISIKLGGNVDRDVVVVVDDDGLPFPSATDSQGQGMGLGLVKRLTASIGGVFIMPIGQVKKFEIKVPVKSV